HLTDVLAEKEVDFTIHELLTLASIVERESKIDDDRPKIAQVFINRIDLDMKLQSDITASYALGEHKILMSYDDIAIESPYNTYSIKGLPVGPIDSPSIESIQAVITPDGKRSEERYIYARLYCETVYTIKL